MAQKLGDMASKFSKGRGITALVGLAATQSKFTIDGSHRAIMFSCIGGVQNTIYPDRFQFRIPSIQHPIVRDACSKFRKISTSAKIEDVPMANISPLRAQEVISADDYFGVGKLFTLEDLFNARVHLGHKEGTLNDHMRPYIYGKRIGVLIIDLEQTAQLLKYALNVTAHIAYNKGLILFVNRSRQTGRIVELAAKECGEYAHCRKWRYQSFTNADCFFDMVTRLPDLCIFFSTLNSSMTTHLGVSNSAKMLIPTIGIVDTNSNPTLITYPVPGNDDTPVAIKFYADLFKKTILMAKQKRAEHEAEMRPVKMIDTHDQH